MFWYSPCWTAGVGKLGVCELEHSQGVLYCLPHASLQLLALAQTAYSTAPAFFILSPFQTYMRKALSMVRPLQCRSRPCCAFTALLCFEVPRASLPGSLQRGALLG